MIDRNETVLQGTVSGAAVTYSEQIAHHKSVYIQGKWTGTGIVGFAKLRGSHDGSNWLDIEGSRVDFTAAGGASWDITERNYPYILIHMESTSGAVTFTADRVLMRESRLG